MVKSIIYPQIIDYLENSLLFNMVLSIWDINISHNIQKCF